MAEGIDDARVGEWLDRHVPGAAGPFEFTLISGGRSNLTFEVRGSGAGRFVLRRPPTSQVLPTAHDMSREYRVISALQGTGVPVPITYALCEDPSVTGAPFYVMSYVDGLIVRDSRAARQLSIASRYKASLSLIDTLATLHGVDVDSVGLGDLARRDGYIARQLKRWYTQFTTSQQLTGRKVPAVDEVHDLLASRIPAQGPGTIVHGDYRLDNMVILGSGEVAAILDWEICTLGDPLADLGLLMVYWAEPGDRFSALGVAPTVEEGFAQRSELKSRYAEATGRDLSELDFYIAFGYWKLACILEGVYSRYSAGAAAGDRSDHGVYATQVGTLAEIALETAHSL